MDIPSEDFEILVPYVYTGAGRETGNTVTSETRFISWGRTYPWTNPGLVRSRTV